jgi:hypothetical protein
MKEKYSIDLNFNTQQPQEFEVNDENIMGIRIQLPNGKIVEGQGYKVELSLSPDAMIGLGTNLIRKGLRAKDLDKDLYKNEFEHLIPFDQNSAVTNMGVYVIPGSAELMIDIHEFGKVEIIMDTLKNS